MIYLVLAVLMSALVSIIMRVSEKKRENVVAMFIVNYIICTALSYGFIDELRCRNGNLEISISKQEVNQFEL